jgi:hypothetical protein
VQKEKQAEDNCEEGNVPANSENSDNSARRYYYDDAHGYEDYDPEEAEEDED